ncbi:ATP-binding protein [Candidatus Poribacteria bacterium]|nr:ATP-binding protein [Candidatus Poribacteria bacterium]
MFTKLLDAITFEDVNTFCREQPEGVRVEYKRQIDTKKHIPKMVSAFANTLGGVFLIGVESDKTKNEVVFPIQGIPIEPGYEERIQQSSLEGIYPAVIPEIKIVDVPNSNNIVVIVRVDESIQAPHAIQNSQRTYIRTGSITNPYDLADMDRIAYMLKRREDSQENARQILDRIDDRVKRFCIQDKPSLTVIAQPIYPYRPVITKSDIYELHERQSFPPRKVAGGIADVRNDNTFLEMNEFGIVYHRRILPEHQQLNEHREFTGVALNYCEFIRTIRFLIYHAMMLYEKCEYVGNIMVSAKLQNVIRTQLYEPESNYIEKFTEHIVDGPVCSDSEVYASTQCMPRDFNNSDRLIDIVEELVHQLIWAYNIPINETWVKDRVGKQIEYYIHKINH